MTDTLLDLVINVLASAIWVIAGILATAAYYYFVEKVPVRRVWNIGNHSREIYMAVTNLAPQKAAEYDRPTTGIGELEAVSFIRESLVTGYPALSAKIHIVFSNRFPETGLTSDIVSIGGTKHNEITRLFAKALDTPLNFLYDPVTIAIDKTTGKTYQPRLDETDIIIDYGLITRMPNPFNTQTAIVLLRGAHTYGVAGCGRILTPPYISSLSKHIQKLESPYWQALILVKCVGLQVFPELVVIKPLASNFFSSQVKTDMERPS